MQKSSRRTGSPRTKLIRSFAAASLVAGALSACGGTIEDTLSSEVAGDDAVAMEADQVSSAITQSELTLEVRDTAGIGRTGEVVRSGVPLAKGLNLRSTAGMAIVNAAGTAVPAELTVLARWNAGKNDANAPIQWLLVTFAADVPARGTAQYRLSVDGSRANPAPAAPLTLTKSGDRVTVNTGAATFVVDGAVQSLFQEVRAGSTVVAGARPISGTVDGRAVSHSNLRRVFVEHQGPLSAVVVVEGAYDMPQVGGGGLGSRRRYVFTAGSPTAIVRHSAAYEGDKCGPGVISCNGSPNALLVTRLRDGLSLSLPATRTVHAIGARASGSVTGNANVGSTASIRQRLRNTRTAPRVYEVSAGGQAQNGATADGAVLAVSGGGNTVAIALDHMHFSEPQALRLEADGSLAIDVVDDQAWMGPRQGLYATFAVSAISGVSARADLERLTWAPLNAPLRAWPSNKVFADSRAAGDIPSGSLLAGLTGYDNLTKRVLDDTIRMRNERGVFGISVFGSVPRYWGARSGTDELDCSGNDPTPGTTWDNAYWCGVWTDYHNTNNQAAIRAMRTGEVEYIDEIQEPAALRVLHTQMLQCAPGDSNFYCGQAPQGYAGFRSDFNSSHAYFQNLMNYYWLTGDQTVVETMQRGATSMRNYLCSRRASGGNCTATDRPTDQWAPLTGRVASQWYNAFRFVGLASNDASFLQDYQTGMARAVTQNYLEGVQNGQRYGFWVDGNAPVSGAGRFTTGQLWMTSLYDMEMLNQLSIDTDDAPIGSPAIAPSRVLAAWARTLTTFAPSVMGNGTASASMPNQLDVTTSGSRLDGTLVSVTANTSGSDPVLYDAGKACISGVMARQGRATNNAAMTALALAIATTEITVANNAGTPLGKEQGLFLHQLGAAVARLTSAPGTSGGVTPSPSPSPTATPTPTPSPSPTATPAPTPTPTPTPSPSPAPAAGTVVSSTMDGLTALLAPLAGGAGSLFGIGAGNVVPGAVGTAIRFGASGNRIAFSPAAASVDAMMRKGEIDLRLLPSYGAGDANDSHHTLVVIGDLSNPPALMLEESDTLNLTYIDANWVSHRVTTNWRQPVFAANQWVRITARWDASSTDAMQILVNGVRVDRGGRGAYPATAPRSRTITVGADNYGSYGASAAIDELRISQR